MMHTHDGGSIPATYGDFMEVLVKQSVDIRAESINGPCNRLGAQLRYAIWVDIPLLGVEWSGAVFLQLHGIRSHAQEPDRGFGFGLQDPMTRRQINVWVFS